MSATGFGMCELTTSVIWKRLSLFLKASNCYLPSTKPLGETKAATAEAVAAQLASPSMVLRETMGLF
jgi:hypothetical protein